MYQEQQEDNSMDDICYLENVIIFAHLNNPLSPKLANKHALSKMNSHCNIDGGKQKN